MEERMDWTGEGARREERWEEGAEPGEPPPREEGEEAGCFLEHSRPASVTHSAGRLPGPARDPRAAAADQGEEHCRFRPTPPPRWDRDLARNPAGRELEGGGAGPGPRERPGLGPRPRGLPGCAASQDGPGHRAPARESRTPAPAPPARGETPVGTGYIGVFQLLLESKEQAVYAEVVLCAPL